MDSCLEEVKNRFSFPCTFKRAARIELASLAWKAKVLPLNYARSFYADFSI